MDDLDLIHAAAHALDSLWNHVSVDVEAKGKSRNHDARVHMSVGNERYAFAAQVKRNANVAVAALLAGRATPDAEGAILLITEYAQPAVAQVLQHRGINYADSVGNCHVDHPPLFMHVEGRKRLRTDRVQPVRAFGGEGLKVIFALLLDSGLASRPYRDLAELSEVSHGVVQYTVKDLERLGLLVSVHRTARRLRDLDALLNRWSAGFAETLRPKLSLGTFRFSSPERTTHWKQADLDPETERWGGEPAAATATNYLRPGKLTLYTRSTRADLMRRLRIVPEVDGPIEVLRTFWPQRLEQELPLAFPDATVPDILTYADLVASGDPRNAEVAAMLQEQFSERVHRA